MSDSIYLWGRIVWFELWFKLSQLKELHFVFSRLCKISNLEMKGCFNGQCKFYISNTEMKSLLDKRHQWGWFGLQIKQIATFILKQIALLVGRKKNYQCIHLNLGLLKTKILGGFLMLLGEREVRKKITNPVLFFSLIVSVIIEIAVHKCM